MQIMTRQLLIIFSLMLISASALASGQLLVNEVQQTLASVPITAHSDNEGDNTDSFGVAKLFDVSTAIVDSYALIDITQHDFRRPLSSFDARAPPHFN